MEDFFNTKPIPKEKIGLKLNLNFHFNPEKALKSQKSKCFFFCKEKDNSNNCFLSLLVYNNSDEEKKFYEKCKKCKEGYFTLSH
jgi:hypothetical protein